MSACRICHSAIEPFIDFGRMPLANGFLTPDQFADEYFFNLSAAYCACCTLVQLVEQPQRERMFNERYPFFSASSTRMVSHFGSLAAEVIATLPKNDALVVEIGSNDGTLLGHVANAGIRHLGIEPSASVAKAAAARGISTVRAFFDDGLARAIVAQQGQADAVIAVNALSHVGDVHSVVGGIKHLLAPGGTCVIEDPYWGDVVAQTAFDQIYDEHASYFTLSSMRNLLGAHGLDVADVQPTAVHGGSMRYWICHAGLRPPTDRVAELINREGTTGLHRFETLTAFRGRVSAIGDQLMTLLRSYRAEHKRIVGYGATSKSTTTINFFGITQELIEFISDTTPAKQGTCTPGAHIPVRPHEEFAARYPDRALLFSWNHAAEIRSREQAFTDARGKWIVYVPEVGEI